MTDIEKRNSIRVFLPSDATISDAVLNAYLGFAEKEILNWLYALYPEAEEEFSEKYDTVQVMSVVVGLGLVGGNGESSHSENGISRQFEYSTMLSFIRANVSPYMRVV